MRFVPNPQAPALLARTTEMVEFLGVVAEAAAENARGFAPVRSGSYRDGIEGQAGIVEGQAEGRVNARDFKSGWIEFGTGQPGPTPAFAPLRRGADATGLKLIGGR